MKKYSTSLYWCSANICMFLGVISVLSAYVAILASETFFEVTKPFTIVSFLLVFPFFIAFVLIGFVSSTRSFGTKNDSRKKTRDFIKSSLNDFLEPIRILLSINKIHLVTCLSLLISSAFLYKTQTIGGINWAFGSPFEREHAISFGTTAAIFYAIMLPFYSHRSAKSAFFNTES